MKQARDLWFQRIPEWNPESLVFVDETAAATNMTPLRGWAPKGRKLIDRTPHGHWKTTTFIAGLRHDGLAAPYVLDGPVNGTFFLAWVQQCLVPTLGPGDHVILDNLSSHKVSGVREAIEGVGARLSYLPAYSPDLNPIEMLFAMLKQRLRKASERTVEGLWIAIGKLLDTFTSEQCAACIRHVGYGQPQGI